MDLTYSVYPQDDVSTKPAPRKRNSICNSVLLKVFIFLVFLTPILFYANRKLSLHTPDITNDLQHIFVQLSEFRPTFDDQYVCMSYHLDPNRTYYVTEFTTIDPNAAAHHMILFACSYPAFPNGELWSCGEMGNQENMGRKLPRGPICGPMDMEVIFAEAMQAGTYVLPQNVSFKLGKMSKFNYLTLQVHYASTEQFHKKRRLVDYSGFQLTLSPNQTKYNAHVMLIASGYGELKARKTTNLDLLCTVRASNEKTKMIPFAFRTHAHSLGKMITGYKITKPSRTNWILIARKSPQLRQTFYPILGNTTIKYLDRLAVRCFYDNPTEKDVWIGNTKQDEMCNLYIMYYTESDGEVYEDCRDGWGTYYDLPQLQKIFDESSKLTKEEENEVNTHKHMGH